MPVRGGRRRAAQEDDGHHQHEGEDGRRDGESGPEAEQAARPAENGRPEGDPRGDERVEDAARVAGLEAVLPAQRFERRVADGDAEAVLAWAADRLAPYKRPRVVHAVGALPRNAMGKVVRNRLFPP